MKFHEIVDSISNRSPFQKKRLKSYLAECDDTFHREADEFAFRYGDFLAKRGISMDYAVDAYLKMCRDMLRCQVEYLRTGSYPQVTAEQAKAAVYESETEMLSYMVGLGISQFLWPTHYQMFSFFKKAIDNNAGSVSSYLEIGPGHGLFLEYALSQLHKLSVAVAIDISPTSFDLSRSIIQSCASVQKEVKFVLGDVTKTDFDSHFDFVTMGEVLEHVNQPKILLQKLKTLLAPGGRAFVSTCANCPAIDHVVQFNSLQQIRDLITSAGLIIRRDLALPVEPMSVQEAEAKRVTINFCALLE
jgi:SAM-dependent methyltransferase